jgi:signal transduction histidine kinase/ActR/RegA family two-component response regulator
VIRLDIRSRMLAAALLPVVIVSMLLAAAFSLAWSDDLQQAHQLRLRSVARQLAMASEYGLFSANQTQLQAVVHGALREPDVRGVVVLDKQGKIMAQAGEVISINSLRIGIGEKQVFDEQGRLDTLSQPVLANRLSLDDLYEETATGASSFPVPVGQVVVVFSRQALEAHKQRTLILAGLISLVGIAFGVLLAIGLSRGVVRPMLQMSGLIERIGRGEFSAASESHIGNLNEDDPLGELQMTLRKMAARLAHARDDLEQQVAVATQAMREKKEEAELATQAKTRFLAAASHDLRQPTHALGMFVARLAQLPHDAQTGELIRNLQASVLAMQSLLDSLLDLSRLEANAVSVKCQAFALSGLMTQLGLDLAQSASDKGLRLRIRTTDLYVLSDAHLVYRILLNLVGNALRYTQRGGVLVACRVVNGGKHVAIQVWDTGIGISPEHQQDVFKEFYQVGNAGRDRNLGLGLGLNIVHRTAELLGHPLELRSRPGVGSRFSLTLPVVDAVPQAATVPTANPEPQDDLMGVSVWVVEDDELVRDALVGLLKAWGMNVFAAQDVQGALTFCLQGMRPDLILSDYRLQQGQNGIAVIERLRLQLNSPIPACLMSGNTDADLMAAAQVAALTLLHKPVRPAKLRSLLRRLLMKNQPGEEDLR